MLWICRDCTCAYSVGAARCPQCGSTDHVEEGTDMGKISRRGGPSVAGQTIPDTAPPAGTEDAEIETEQEVPDYDAWDYRELQAELKRRGLSAQGERDVLVERLVDDDKAGGDG